MRWRAGVCRVFAPSQVATLPAAASLVSLPDRAVGNGYEGTMRGPALLGLRDGPTLDASSKHRPAMTEQVAEAPGDQVVEQHVDRECSGGA